MLGDAKCSRRSFNFKSHDKSTTGTRAWSIRIDHSRKKRYARGDVRGLSARILPASSTGLSTRVKCAQNAKRRKTAAAASGYRRRRPIKSLVVCSSRPDDRKCTVGEIWSRNFYLHTHARARARTHIYIEKKENNPSAKKRGT